MTSNLQSFKTIDKGYFSKVKIGDGRWLEVHGKGAVVIQTPSGTKLISDVLFVPEINRNLLSVGQLLDKDYALFFKNKSCEIVDPNGEKLFSIKMHNRSFLLEWKLVQAQAFTSLEDESCLWHKRFGHINYTSLKLLQNKSCKYA